MRDQYEQQRRMKKQQRFSRAGTLSASLVLIGFAPLPAWAQPARAPAPRAAPALPPLPPPPPMAPVAPAPVPDPLPELVDPWIALDAAATPLSLADAVDTALRIHPSIQTARAELKARRADVDAARGPFDPTLTASLTHAREASPIIPAQRLTEAQGPTRTDTTDFTVGATAATTFGLSIAPTIGFQRVHQRIDVPGVPNDPFQQAHVGIGLVQHLLRGAGWVGAASAVDRARGARKAAEYTIAFAAQQQALATAIAYYQLVAAADQLALLRDAMAGARRLSDETRVLVASDQRPRTDLHQIDGNLATRMRSVVEARNAQIQALYALRAAMGLGIDARVALRPTDALPYAALPGGQDRPALIRLARQRRADLSAARELVGAAGADLRGAEWNTHAAVDLSASAGFVGFQDKDGVGPFFSAAGANVPGLNAGVGLSGELPLNNTARIAFRDQRRALYDEAKIAQMDIERRLPLDTLSALEDLELSASALRASDAAVENLAAAVQDEQDRMRSGVGTVIDLLLTEDRLISARLARSGNQLRYAIAKSRLLFETGGMPSDPGSANVALRELASPAPLPLNGANAGK